MRVLLIVTLLALLVVPPSTEGANGKDWTVLVYLDADNNLEEVGLVDFLEMAAVGSTERVNVAVQFDRSAAYSTAYGDWTTAKRFYVTQGMEPLPQNALMDLGEVNMADPATLVSFVNWGIANYPAAYYFLVLWDHGDGWQGVVVDDDPVSGDRLTATELRTALQAITIANGRRIDLLGNDACRMSLEIQYEVADFVDYFVGSEKDEPIDGWPYDAFLSDLVADSGRTPPAVAAGLVDRYVESYEGVSAYSVTLSVVSAAGLRSLATALNEFLAEVSVHQPYFTAEIVAARDATERYERAGGLCCGNEYDLYHFVENVVDKVPSLRLERKAVPLLAAIDGAVLYERHWDHPNPINGVHVANAHGLSIWFAAPPGGYDQLALSRDTLWDEFLGTYATGERPLVPVDVFAGSVDADGDGLLDTLLLSFTSTASGTMAIDVYRGTELVALLDVSVVADRPDTVRRRPALAGYHEVTFYLLDGSGILVNLTTISGLAIERLVAYEGIVTDGSGRPVEGAVVTLHNLRTSENRSAMTVDGRYAVSVTYPTWVRDADPLALDVRWGDLAVRLTFEAPSEPRGLVQDVTLEPLDSPWPVIALAFGTIAAAGVAGALYFHLRLRRFRKIP